MLEDSKKSRKDKEDDYIQPITWEEYSTKEPLSKVIERVVKEGMKSRSK